MIINSPELDSTVSIYNENHIIRTGSLLYTDPLLISDIYGTSLSALSLVNKTLPILDPTTHILPNGINANICNITVGGSVIQYLLRDDFLYAVSTGSINNTASTPGPGIRTIVDSQNLLSITPELLTFAGGKGTPSYGDPGIWWSSISRVPGTMFVCNFNATTLANGRIGWVSTSGGSTTEHGVKLAGNLKTRDASIDGANITDTISTSTNYYLTNILRSNGDFVFIKGGIYAYWTLAWTGIAGNSNPIFPVMANYNNVYTSDFVRVPTAIYLPIPLASDSFNRVNSASSLGITDGLGHFEVNGGNGLTWTTGSLNTWGISGSSAAVNTLLSGSELLINGGMEIDAGFTNSGTPSVQAQSTEQVHSGSYSRKVSGSTANDGFYGSGSILSHSGGLGSLFKLSAWFYIINGSAKLFDANGNGNGPSVGTAGSWVQTTWTYRDFTNGQNPGARITSSASATLTFYTDDMSLQKLNLKDLFSSLQLSSSNVFIDVKVSVHSVGTQVGCVARLDSSSSPLSFIIAYFNMGNVRVDQWLNGTSSSLISTAKIFTANDRIVLDLSGSLLRCYHVTTAGVSTLIGTSTTNVITGNLHGIFSTDSGNSITDFIVWAKGNENQYSILDTYSTNESLNSPETDNNVNIYNELHLIRTGNLLYTDPLLISDIYATSMSALNILNTSLPSSDPTTHILPDGINAEIFTINSLGYTEPIWLLRDEFNDNRLSGSLNGTLATDGVNTRVVIDTNNKLSTGSGFLITAGSSVAGANGDPGIWYNQITRIPGRFAITKVNITTGSQNFPLGFDTNQTDLVSGNAFKFKSGAEIDVGIENGNAGVAGGSYNLSTDYYLALILRQSGAFYLIKGGLFTNWTLLLATTLNSTSTLYPNIGNFTGVFTNDFIRIPQSIYLPVPLASDSFNRVDNLSLGLTDGLGNFEANGGNGLVWSGSPNWSISGSAMINTPVTGSNVILNGDFSLWTSGSPNSWTENGTSGSIRTITNAGSAVQFIGDGGANLYITQQNVLVSGSWYYITIDVISASSGSIQIGTAADAVILTGGSGIGKLRTLRSSKENTYIGNNFSSFNITIDNVAFNPIPPNNLFSSLSINNINTIVDVKIGALTSFTQAGCVARLDSVIDPRNYIIAYQNGNDKINVDECVNGISASLISTSQAFSAGNNIILILNGSSLRCIYVSTGSVVTLMGTATTHITSGSLYGGFSTYSANKIDNIVIWPIGTENQYSDLDMYL